MSGPVCPPRNPTVVHPRSLALSAAATPTRKEPSCSLNVRSTTSGMAAVGLVSPHAEPQDAYPSITPQTIPITAIGSANVRSHFGIASPPVSDPPSPPGPAAPDSPAGPEPSSNGFHGKLRAAKDVRMDDDATLVEDLRRRIAASPFHAGFGISVEHAAAGDVLLGWEARPDHRNLQGLVHGGILATLVDIAMGLAIRTVVGPSRRHVTIDLGVHYLRPARPGRLEAAGTALRVGSQRGVGEGRVTAATGRW